MRKRILLVFALLAVVLLLVACGRQSDSTASVADTYQTVAREFMETGDYAAAIQTLEKGVEATGDEELAQLLAEALKAQAAQAEAESAGQEESQPSAQDGADGAAELTAQPVETETPSAEPTPEPTPTPTPTPKPAGDFDDYIGEWSDTIYDIGSPYMTISYRDSSKQHVDVEFQFPRADLLRGELKRDGNGLVYVNLVSVYGGDMKLELELDGAGGMNGYETRSDYSDATEYYFVRY